MSVLKHGETPGGGGFTMTGGRLGGVVAVKADNGSALVEARPITAGERALRDARARAERSRAAFDAIYGKVYPHQRLANGALSLGARPAVSVDTGMAVGSQVAAEHAAALARHAGSDITGGGYTQARLDSMRAANRAAGFGRSHPIGRRRDALEVAFGNLDSVREKTAAQLSEYGKDREELQRQFDATLQHGANAAKWDLKRLREDAAIRQRERRKALENALETKQTADADKEAKAKEEREALIKGRLENAEKVLAFLDEQGVGLTPASYEAVFGDRIGLPEFIAMYGHGAPQGAAIA